MKNLKRYAVALSALFFVIACEPNGDKNSTDVKNSDKEGAVDSTKMPDFDSIAAPADTTHASVVNHKIATAG